MNGQLKLIFIGVLAVLSPAVAAQSFPSKPIRLVLGSPPGGPVDTIARIVVRGWSKTLRQQIVVDNRGGAAGLIGTDIVVKSSSDGYTLLFGFSGPLAIVPNLNPNTPYDPVRDLEPVSQVAAAPYVLLVHPSVPAKSVKQLVALAKASPGKMNFSSGGNGVGIHMAGELFKVAAGVNIVHVPYKGAANGVTALMAGEVDMMFNGLSPSLPHIKSGKLRALAVGGAKRSHLLPNIPTVLESGFDFNTEGWYGVVAPKGTPAAAIQALHQTLVDAMGTREMKTQLEKLAIDGGATTPSEFAKLIRDENARWKKVIAVAGIKMQ